MRDFAWWSGLTLTDARMAHAAVGDAVTAFDAERYVAADAGWPADPAAAAPRATGKLALAAFDEYFLGYTDRTAVCDPEFAGRVIPGGNGVFQPILVSGGRVVGTWKRKPGGRAGAGIRHHRPVHLREGPRLRPRIRCAGRDSGDTPRRGRPGLSAAERGTGGRAQRDRPFRESDYCSSEACSSRVMVTFSPRSTPPVSSAAL